MLACFCQSLISVAHANGEGHWAFQPIHKPAIPEVRNAIKVRNSIDSFILARLESAQLGPSPEASREALVRRLSFDIIGLPPTFDEVKTFLNDRRPDAYERLVDRLLGSPHYGERWGRFWLDVARYADTKGYVFRESRSYPFAYTYREWVIQALNGDMPYDDFVRRQLAADLLPGLPAFDLAALGFLTVGNRFLNRDHLIIDDRIDVVTRGLMGLTVSCARCHDHFFDPVPQKDYYSLYGVFASSEEPKELPVIGEPPDSPEYRNYLAELKKREGAIQKFLRDKSDQLRTEENLKSYLEVILDSMGKDDEQLTILSDKRKLYPKFSRRWRDFLKQKSGKEDLVWGPWNVLLAVPEENLSLELLPETSHPLVRKTLKEANPRTHKAVVAVYAKLLAEAFAVRDGRIPRKAALVGLVKNGSFPPNVSPEEIEPLFNRPDREKLVGLRKKVQSYITQSESAPPRAMVLRDLPKPVAQKVFIRGKPGIHGETVKRQFLEVLSRDGRKSFADDGSGRLDLAEAIVDVRNPLTARVIVNRVWMHHFGRGFVATPSDFGAQGDPPTHPGLLDHLALGLMESGWSLKALHRLILTSATYRQSSLVNAGNIQVIDPENRLLSQMNRRRLGFEAMRDAMVFVAGRMDTRIGGRSTDLEKRPYTGRRAVYGKTVRQNVPALFRTFDVANPSIHTPIRPETTVPQQALFAMNNEFVQEKSLQLSSGLREREPKARVRELYCRVLSRQPTGKELALALQFLAQSKFEQLAQVLLMSNEFLFVD